MKRRFVLFWRSLTTLWKTKGKVVELRPHCSELADIGIELFFKIQ
jgi:hypothetical protein